MTDNFQNLPRVPALQPPANSLLALHADAAWIAAGMPVAGQAVFTARQASHPAPFMRECLPSTFPLSASDAISGVVRSQCLRTIDLPR